MLATLVVSALLFSAPQQVISQQIETHYSGKSSQTTLCYRSSGAHENEVLNNDLSTGSPSPYGGSIDDAPPQSGKVNVRHEDDLGKQQVPAADSDSGNYLSD